MQISHFPFQLLSFAQQKKEQGIIIGNVIGNNGKPVADATVILRKTNDTINYKNTISDKTGSFEFLDLPMGYYSLVFKNIGFTTLTIDSIFLRAERYDFNLGDIKLNDTSSLLDDVIIYVEKPLIENKDGKLTYNVGESALSNGASATELLKQMPLINNDADGKLLLKGKEPKILIDDKPVDLTSQQLADLLESLPGSSIEKIELMMNPPPQYAGEQGGVINIVTKKAKIGWLGRANISGGTRGEGSVGGNLSYREKKLSININANLGISRLKGSSYSRRNNLYADSTNYFNTDSRYLNKNTRPNLRLQSDYELNKKNSFNFVYQGNLNFFDNESVTEYRNINSLKAVSRYSRRTNSTSGDGFNSTVNFTYTYKMDSGRGTLRFIASGSLNNNNNDRDFYQQYLFINYAPSSADSTQQQLTDNKSRSYSFRLNYDRPIKRNVLDVSAGAYYMHNGSDIDLNTDFLRKPDNVFVPNEILSNNFNYRQGIANARAAAIITLPKSFKVTTGIAYERTEISFKFYSGNTANVTNSFGNWLPNISIRKDFTKEWNAAIVYRASIRRPGIGELNPNVDYSDPYNTRAGNPYLLPQVADNYDLNVSYIKSKYYVNFSAGYNKVKNVYSRIKTLSPNAVGTQSIFENIAGRNEYETSMWGGYTLSKKIRLNASAGYTFNTYDARLKQLFNYRNGGSFYTSINYSYTLSNVMSFDGNARYSSFADPQGRSRSNLNMNIGAQRKFFNRRLTLSLNIIDPFTKQRYSIFTYGTNYTLESVTATNTRNFRLALSYQLNKVVQKKKPLVLPKAKAVKPVTK